MMKRSKFLLYLVLVTVGFADEPPLPIYVSFQFRDASIRDGAATEAVLSEILAERLQNEFKFWKFVPSAGNLYPAVRFWLKSNAEWDIYMGLIARAGDAARQEWSGNLFLPEDMTRMGDALPQGNAWKPEIKRAFINKLLEPNREKILRAMRDKVWVGEKAEFDPSPPSLPVQAILHLPKQAFEILADHAFRIKYHSASEEVWLLSQGTGLYDDTRQGIRVVVLEWLSPSAPKVPVEKRVSSLPSLKPLQFYFGERLDPTISVAP